MYIEVHPVIFDNISWINNRQDKQADHYKDGEPVILRTDTIRKMNRQDSPDKSITLYRIEISEDYHEDLLVTIEEGEKIKKTLLKNDASLSKEISTLSTVIRNLYELLRARLH